MGKLRVREMVFRRKWLVIVMYKKWLVILTMRRVKYTLWIV